MISEPKTVPIPAPEPATPTVAAPAPMNLAAESISRVAGEVWNDLTCGRRATGVVFWAAKHWLCEITALLNGRRTFEPLATMRGATRQADVTNILIQRII